jgi:hypothetical protein
MWGIVCDHLRISSCYFVYGFQFTEMSFALYSYMLLITISGLNYKPHLKKTIKALLLDSFISIFFLSKSTHN